jgi:hypothetical protein
MMPFAIVQVRGFVNGDLRSATFDLRRLDSLAGLTIIHNLLRSVLWYSYVMTKKGSGVVWGRVCMKGWPMRVNKRGLFGLACLSLLFVAEVSAHDIQVSRVRLTDWDEARQCVMVTFDLAWNNAWRDAGNWDAAWVFVKVKPAGSNDWRHATLSPEGRVR